MKPATVLATGTAGVGAALLGYATLVEPFAIEVVRVELSLPRLPPAFDGYTIYQISDLHTQTFGRRERTLASLAEQLPPADVIAYTGDMIHTEKGIGPFLQVAEKFTARDGAFAVFGNSEHKNGVRPARFARVLEEHGITPLLNIHTVLTRDGALLALAGTDDPVSNRDDVSGAVSGVWQGLCTVLLMHSPDPIAEACVRGVDLVLSGHTHGGQVRFPFARPPYTHNLLGRDMSNGYYAGWQLHKLTGTRAGRTQLYVTRGIGISGLALRFLVRPEFTVITLRRGLPGKI